MELTRSARTLPGARYADGATKVTSSFMGWKAAVAKAKGFGEF